MFGDMLPTWNDQQSVSRLAFSYPESRSGTGRGRVNAVDRRTIHSILGAVARSPTCGFQFLPGVWSPCIARGHFRILAAQAYGAMGFLCGCLKLLLGWLWRLAEVGWQDLAS